jgi:sensor histidine kinase YesM
MSKNEIKICWYSALFITLAVNSARLMALRQNGIIARYWQFNITEYSFQFLYNMLFCAFLSFINLEEGKWLSIYRQNRQLVRYYLYNVMVIIAATILGGAIQYKLFAGGHIPGMIARGYIARFIVSSILVAVIIRLVLLMRESKRKDTINEQLKTAYLEAQLEALKSHLNPHLFFNSLSSLSGIVREDPRLAQGYIFHLSNVFRHALVHSGTSLVPIEQEINMIKSYEQLIVLRLENGFHLNINVQSSLLHYRIPHLSLQPLLENATKHNMATPEKPLTIHIYDDHGWLNVSNNLQPIDTPESSTGIGLVNLNERFRLLLHREIEISKTKDHFLVKLPLIA